MIADSEHLILIRLAFKSNENWLKSKSNQIKKKLNRCNSTPRQHQSFANSLGPDLLKNKLL
jgi:hypothetical protein